MKKKIGSIICLMLLLSMTSIGVIGQKINSENNMDILINQNNPPNDPIITGPDKVKKNKFFNIKIMSTDPDGDNIYYRLKINDGRPSNWWGPLDSGHEDMFSFLFLFYTGDLIFGAQAKDEHGAISDWSYHKTTYIHPREHNFIENSFFAFLGRIFQLINR